MTRDEFIEEFKMRLAERAGLCEPQVRVELSTPSGDAVSLDLIRVDPSARRHGIARKVLKALLSLSDETGIPLQVIPRCVEEGGLSDEALEAWSGKNDFVPTPTPETPRLMRRTPQDLDNLLDLLPFLNW